MGSEPRPAPGQVLYHGRYRRTSLFWLVMSLLFGGTFLAGYFTIPGAPVANLIAALILGLPIFALSLRSLGRSKALILYRDLDRFRCVEGAFHHRTSEEYACSEVTGVDRIQAPHRGDPGASEDRWLVRIFLTRGRSLVLEQFEKAGADDLVARLRSEFGLLEIRGR